MKRTFTLIEGMIVFAIIAIVAATAIPNIMEARFQATYKRVVLGKGSFEDIATIKEAYSVKMWKDSLEKARKSYGPLPWEIVPVEKPVSSNEPNVQELNKKIESLQDKVKQLQSKVVPLTYEVKMVQQDSWVYAVVRSDGVTIFTDKDPAVCRNLVKYLEEAFQNGYNQPKE